MKKFEYHIEKFTDFSDMQEIFNLLGKSGWELVSTFLDSVNGRPAVVGIFKKEIK